MSDLQRTVTYLAIALAAVIVAWEPWRTAPKAVDEAEEEARLFPEFKDPLDAKSMEIVKFDEATSTPEPPFKVAQHNGVWSIPSHSNYPADAHDHMAKAAACLIDLEALGKVSDNAGDRELYGVVDPDPKTLRAGDMGVGMRVTMRDIKDEVLADLIIGKTVKDQPDLRYVRKAGINQIYKVALNTSALSTKFEDWIEKDLLKLKAMDVKEVNLNDYTAAVPAQGTNLVVQPDLHSRIKLDFDDAKSKWSLVDLIEYEDRKPVTKKLADDEELNSDKLNGLKTALSNLKIVDVQPKPKGLSRDLRASADFVKDNDGIGSLMRNGFYPVPAEDDKIEIYSRDGQVVCGLKDGVEYVLRFGDVAGAGSKEVKSEDKPDGGKKDEPTGEQMNRFIFVMAQLNKDLIPKPELEPVPGEDGAAEDKAAEDKAAEDKAAEDKADGDKKADDKKSDEEAVKKYGDQPADAKGKDAEKAAPAKNDKAKAGKAEDAKAKPEKSKTDKPKTEKASPEKAKAEKGKTDGDKADGEKAAADKTADEKAAPSKEAQAKTAAEEAEEEEKSRLAAEKRLTIKKLNKRKQSEYDEKVAAAEKRVTELNDRFADWYYIIPDSVYRNIHLSRADIVKMKDKAAGKHDDHDHDHEDEDHPAKLPNLDSLPKFPQE